MYPSAVAGWRRRRSRGVGEWEEGEGGGRRGGK